MADDSYKRLEPFWGSWFVTCEIGRGTFGKVYEIYSKDYLGHRSTSALKIIHIPLNEGDLKAQIQLQPDMAAVEQYFVQQVKKLFVKLRY